MNTFQKHPWWVLLAWIGLTVVILIGLALLVNLPVQGTFRSPLETPVLSVRDYLPIIQCQGCPAYTLTPTPRGTLPAPSDTPTPFDRPTLPGDTPTITPIPSATKGL